jgi:putative hydrolase of the HAD superfamily
MKVRPIGAIPTRGNSGRGAPHGIGISVIMGKSRARSEHEQSDRMEEKLMIKAVIFDFDGLIIDTESAWYEAYREVIERHYGIDMPIEVWGNVIGTSMDVFNPFAYLAEQTGKTLDEQLLQREAQPVFRRLMREQGLRPGVADYLQEAKRLGLSIALASSSGIGWIRPFLEQHDLVGYFDVLTTADDVARVKPDPELYVKSLERLGIAGEEAVAFEDSVNGSNAAKAAGVHCVIVPNRVTSHMAFERYDLRIASMDAMPLQQVLAHFNP